MKPRRVLVTRSADQAGKLSRALRAHGFQPVEVPVLEFVPPADFAPLDAAIQNLVLFDWLILTSTNAVQALAQRATSIGQKLTAEKVKKIAAVGRATAQAIESLGLTVSLTPERYVAEGLLAEFAKLGLNLSTQKILLIRAAVARDVIPDALRSLGAQVEIVEAYRNQTPPSAPEQIAAALKGGLDFAAFTSSSSVTHLRAAADAANLPWPFPNVKAISIGPVTTQTLNENNWPPAAESNPYDISGLVEAISTML